MSTSKMASRRLSSEKSSVLTKEALQDLNLHEFDVLDGWEPSSGKVYTKVRAISARINQNFDGWPSEELKKSYRTFLGKPVFVNHVNDDPRKARGVVVAARFVENDDDKYIEVIQEVDADKFPMLAHELVTGGLDSVSMGAEARICKCSYCGNEAGDMMSMCAHVLGQKGQILSKVNDDGTREDVLIYEECRDISFFELSYVFDPADETAVVSNVLTANKKRGYGETSLPPQVDTLRDEEEDLGGYFIEPPMEFQEPDLDKEYPAIGRGEPLDNRRDEDEREDVQMTRVSRGPRRNRNGDTMPNRAHMSRRRRYYADNDQGEQEEVFISQTPPAEPVETGEGAADAPNNTKSDRVKTDQNRSTHTNFEARRRARRRHAAPDLYRDFLEYAQGQGMDLDRMQELYDRNYESNGMDDEADQAVHEFETMMYDFLGADSVDDDSRVYELMEAPGSFEINHPDNFRSSRRRARRRTARGVDFSRATYDLFEDGSGDSWYDLVDEDHRSYDSDDLDEVAAWLQQDGLLPSDGRADFYVADPYEDPYGSQRYEDSAALRGFSDEELNSLRERFSSRKPQRRSRRRVAAPGFDPNISDESLLAGAEIAEVLQNGYPDNVEMRDKFQELIEEANNRGLNYEQWKNRHARRRMAEQSDDFDINSRADIARNVEDEDLFDTPVETQPKDASRRRALRRRPNRQARRRASRGPIRLIQSMTVNLRGPHKTAEYNGWSNWETWNTALWYGNDPGAYELAKSAQSPEELRENAPYVVGDEVDFDQVDWNEVFDAFEEDRTASLRRVRVANIRGPRRTAEYNGWSNWETWNTALWYGNDPGAYELAKSARSPEELAENAPYVVGDDVDFNQVNWDEVYDAFEEDRTASRRRRSSRRRVANGVQEADLLDAPDGTTVIQDHPEFGDVELTKSNGRWKNKEYKADMASEEIGNQPELLRWKNASRRRRRMADTNLDLAAPDGRVNVEAPVKDTTDEEAQASQFDKGDYGHNAGDHLADPDLSTDQNWAPGEGNKTSRRASQIEGMRLAEAMVEAGLEKHDDRWKLAESYTKLPSAIVRDRIALLSRTASVKSPSRDDNGQRPIKSARKAPGLGQRPSLQKSAENKSDDYSLYF